MANQPVPSTSATPAAPAAAPAAIDPKAAQANPVSKTTVAPVDDSWDVHEDGRVVKRSRKEIIDAYQLRQLSDKKRSEADKTLSEYNKLFEVYKKDPIKFMQATGVDFDKLSTSYLSKKAEDAMLSPEVRESNKLKAENEQYKKWIEEQKTNKERLDKDAAIGVERERIHGEIVQAIEEAKDLGMPVDEELVIAIAQKMLLQDKKQKPLNAKEALPKAYESTQKWLQGMASKMEGEAIVKWLGKDVAMKIRKYDLTQLKAKRASPAQGQSLVKTPTAKKSEAPKYKTWSQFAEGLKEIK
jgi:phosphopantetheinyl transferase